MNRTARLLLLALLWLSPMASSTAWPAARGAQEQPPLTVEDMACKGNVHTSCTFILGQVYLASAPANSGFRPDLVPGVPIYLNKPGDKGAYLNPAAFALPAAGEFGNLGRGAIRQPGIENIDFSVVKNWRMRERYGIQFRAEMFNIFNHTNFNGFDTNLAFQNLRSDPNFGKSNNGNFGRFTSTLGPREIQFGLKFTF